MPDGIFCTSVYGSPYFSSIYNSNTNRDITEKKYINRWDYIPNDFLFHRVSDEEELYLGVELEIDSGGEIEENAKHVCDFMNKENENVYCKHDGSLSRGFEIVTHPCTLEYHKQLSYEELFGWLTKNEYRSHDTTTCGMHVHINRSYFGNSKLEQDLCISKVLYLFEKYWDKVELVARRRSNTYARRFLLEEDETPIDLYAKSQASNKYGAINLKHKNTVEIRIFKGTLNYNTFICTLEFVKTMTRIAKDTDIYQIQFVTWDKIRSMFSDGLKEYISMRENVIKTDKSESNQATTNDTQRVLRSDFFVSSDYANALEELSRRISQATGISSILPSNDGTVIESTEISEEERLRREIIDLRSRVRRCRNGLEERNLNRQIAGLENELRRMRRVI